MVSGEAHGAGAARDMVVASARTTATEIRRAMVSKEGPGGRTASRGHTGLPGGVILGGRRACVLTKRSQGAVKGGGELSRCPVTRCPSATCPGKTLRCNLSHHVAGKGFLGFRMPRGAGRVT